MSLANACHHRATNNPQTTRFRENGLFADFEICQRHLSDFLHFLEFAGERCSAWTWTQKTFDRARQGVSIDVHLHKIRRRNEYVIFILRTLWATSSARLLIKISVRVEFGHQTN